ncbi:Pleiotropic drug resistance protein 1 [Capsicum annuum]|uniref:Pleiotropic drug resistance protein 1 n=1 Tax=Capsicum annuum TaxID=4072 RepID=A0A2G2YBD7_CAPAN|nr:Pleiotropic drug resistance protein 1 [Capsicum annuum]
MDQKSLSMRRSIRVNSNSIWRNSNDVFNRSSRDEDDEEALKWAALEKLPTFDRLRKGILLGPQGVANEVDIHDLGKQQSKDLIDRLVKVADEDNEKFLLKLRDRVDRAGMVLPSVEVRYEHLNIEADAYVGSRALPTFTNFITNFLETILNSLHILPNRKRKLTILNDVNGIIKPCRMTLLLGPPSSGKTTLLLALAGKLDPALKKAAKIKPDPDIDIFMKAAAAKGQEASFVTDYVLKLLGLDICADTMVGDEMIRGISGGQKKRVTMGEMLVGPSKALFMDEISTGLDSSTTYSIVNSLRQSVQILNGTAVISLLQPAPETYNLFDDIILLSDGKIVYQGPREDVLGFFEFMGFECPDRKGVADFLQEVTSKKDQKQYWVRSDEIYRYITSEEFADAYQSSHVGRKLRDELAASYDKSRSHPAALSTQKYGIGKKQLLKVCTERELLLMKRNSFVYKFKFTQLLIMALITMTLFFRTEMPRYSIEDGGKYAGALFFIVTMIMFNGLSEIAMTIYKLPIFYKQRDLLFYPSWAYATPSWIFKIPITFVEVGLWVFVTYYVIGFDPSPVRLFKHFLLLILVNMMVSGLFRFIGAAGRTMGVANTFGLFVLLLQFVLGGFVLSRDDVKKWWVWGYWSSPMMYSMNSILVNEFDGKKWKQIAPNGTDSFGAVVVRSRGFFPNAYWYWIGIAFGKPQAIISEGSDDAKTTSIEKEVSNSEDRNKKKGMVLPFESHSITFDKVVYSVDMPQEMKYQGATEDRLVLLKGVSGAFRPGVLTALMGVCDAGKTTLMDVLAGRKTGGYIEGSIKISGYPKKQETFARISGYCEQNDIHSPYVTVYESLAYSAWLRLSHEVDEKTRKMFVEEVMKLVELTPLRSALVGLPGVSGLSTEQRKRLTIAVELVANPSIIFMDEPTLGLDARAAAIVMRTVRNTVDTGRTIVCTIHQPSIDIFEAFDELFLMKRGGKIYVGPLGRHSCHLINYFESIRGLNKIQDGYNPATWMLEVTTPAQEMTLGVDFTDLYKKSDLYRRNKALISELSVPRPGTKDLNFDNQYSQPFWTQCMACLWKQHWSYWRNPAYTAVRFIFTIIIALAIGTMFWDLGTKVDKSLDLFNAMGSMYAPVFFIGFQNTASVMPVVAVERTVFYRERAAGMYSAIPFAFGQAFIELPYVFAQAVTYGVIVYAMIGFEWTVTKFFWNLFFMYFTLLYFTFYGMMTIAVTPNQNVAQIVSTFCSSMWNLFSGFIVPRPRMPIWWRWYYWASPVSWTLYGLLASQFGDLQNKISDTDETVEQFLRRYFGFKHDFLGVVAVMTCVCPTEWDLPTLRIEVFPIEWDLPRLPSRGPGHDRHPEPSVGKDRGTMKEPDRVAAEEYPSLNFPFQFELRGDKQTKKNKVIWQQKNYHTNTIG